MFVLGDKVGVNCLVQLSEAKPAFVDRTDHNNAGFFIILLLFDIATLHYFFSAPLVGLQKDNSD